MGKLFSILAGILLTAIAWAQSPQKMSYQAVIRDASGQLISHTQVGMQISILQGSASGTAVYVETQTPITNANGLISIQIGTGSSSDDFSSIDWASGPFFIKTETDLAGGTAYTIIGTSQVLSVPYALHAKTADNGITPEQANAIVANSAKISAASGTATGQIQYWNGTAWVAVERGSGGQVLTFVNGKPTWGAIPSAGTGEVQNPATGAIWMDRNLGASRVATSSTDAVAYGDLYQWGRGTDGHQKRNSEVTLTLSTSNTPGHENFISTSSGNKDWIEPQNNNLWQGAAGNNNPCPSGFRLPTMAEWEAERASWSSEDAAGAFASVLKLPLGGLRDGEANELNDVGSYGYYWSSTWDNTNAVLMIVIVDMAPIRSRERISGASVRCIKD
jgi:uncharacterized protein (TIGR02145 family)